MRCPAALRRLVDLLARRFVSVFDVQRRREMSKKYRLRDPWGRQRHSGDLAAAIALLPNGRYRRCLDVGTGLGHFAEHAAPVCDQVLAIDISAPAIRRARARLRHVPNIAFAVQNLRRFSAAPCSFDLIILGDVLQCAGDLEFPARFEEMVDRVVALLSPGGRILLSHHVSPYDDDRPEPVISGYAAVFERRGLVLERQQQFRDPPRYVLQAVLRRS